MGDVTEIEAAEKERLRKEKRNAQARARRAANPEKHREYARRYAEKNLTSMRAKSRARMRARRAADPVSDYEYHRAWRAANSVKVREDKQAYHESNRERERAYGREQKRAKRNADPEKAREKARAYRAANVEKLRAYARAYRAANVEKKRANARAYYATLDREKLNVAARARHAGQWSTNPQYRLALSVRGRLRLALKRRGAAKADRTFALIGCSINELVAWLEARFLPGMAWDNYGTWHIDHARPLASFDLTDPAQQRLACHYTNLQPLWGVDNLSKGAQWTFDELGERM